MRLDNLFRLSFYVTLLLAIACLALAESFFLPEMAWCLPALVVIFVVAWRKEGVWVLGETAANHLGIVIALTTAAWILFRVPQTEEQILTSGVPWPAGLLPQLAPVLVILLVVKLFRPKRLPDFWVIQTIGLMMITLGCVLAYQETFGLLLLAYIASLLWCLMLFHFYREQRPAAAAGTPVALFDPVLQEPLEADAVRLPWRLLGLYPVALWLGVIMLTGLPLFLLMPRMAAQQWVPQKLSSSPARARAAMQTGVEPGIDLFRVGHIEPSPEEAFSVSVHDAEGRPCSLPHGTYWRTDVLDNYQRGRWQNWKIMEENQFSAPFLRPPPGAAPPPVHTEPPQTLLLRFTLRPVQAGDLVLAEPVEAPEQEGKVKKLAGINPRIGDRDSRLELFVPRPGCDALMSLVLTNRQLYHYSQELHVPAHLGRIPAAEISIRYRDYLLTQPVPEDIRDWTRELIKHLPGLRDGDRVFDKVDPSERLLPEHHAKIALALTKYLSTSGLFRYTLDLRRKDFNADPTADFLLNTKQGHCERYASGLALMLRGLGIPSRIVKGYRDAERKAEPAAPEQGKSETAGEYLIRQSRAHSWVQALVPDSGQWTWLLLDATPAAETVKGESFSLLAWLGQSLRDGRYFWYNFILEYNNDVQVASARSLGAEAQRGLRWAGRYAIWATPPLLLFWLVWYGRGFLHRAAPTTNSAAEKGGPLFYAQYLRVLADHFRLAPALGQTPLEFSHLASTVLHSDARTTAWAFLPTRLADALYRHRFAGEPLDVAEQSALTSLLSAVERALSTPAKIA